MTGEILVDTNVLVYAYDFSETVKQQRAEDVLNRLTASSVIAVSTQVLAEFYVAVTRKIGDPLTPGEAYKRIEHFLQTWRVIDMSGLVVLEAVRGVRDYQLSYWDAQIWALARLNQISTVFSEDFNQGTTLEGVRFVNPFAPEFQLADWVR